MFSRGSPVASGSATAGGAVGASAVPPRGPSADLVAALHAERAHLADEVLVKNQMIITMGNALAKLRAELQGARAEVDARNEQIHNFTQELAAMRQVSQEATNRSTAAARRLQTLEQDLQSSNEVIEKLGATSQSTEHLHEEIRQLQAQRDELTETMADWKNKVKEALKESRKKEQQLMSTEITLRTEIKALQEQLDKATFQLQSAAVRDARPRQQVAVQTDEVLFADDVRALQRQLSSVRRVSHARALSAQDTMSMTSPNSLGTTVVIPYVAESPPPLPIHQQRATTSGASASAGRALSEGRRFPLPLMLSPQPKPPGVGGGGGGDPTSPDGAAPPVPPPIIVSIHFGTSEGWTLDTKHAVTFRMTVDQLIVNCCEMIKARYGQVVDPTSMCLKMNHDKAKRSVTLSGHRELHSFSYLQKLQRGGEIVKLFLENKDELQERVRVHMDPLLHHHDL